VGSPVTGMQHVGKTNLPVDGQPVGPPSNRSQSSVKLQKNRIGTARRVFDKVFLYLNGWVWRLLPDSLMMTRPILRYGAFLHFYVQRRSERSQYHGTFFLRNRPELELIRTLANQKKIGASLKLAILGCSNGAEVYSIAWIIRSARPDLKLILCAADISTEILEIAEEGLYPLGANRLMDSQIFERLTEEEMRGIFDLEDGHVRIKPWLKEGIVFRVADAGDPGIIASIGTQDIVVANNFLCHMVPEHAETCLRNLVRLVAPGGYLFVSGVDLSIRAKVANDLGWTPVLDRIQEIHNGDPSVRRDWPWRWWGVEPYDGKRSDRDLRYAHLFRIGEQLVAEAIAGSTVK